MDKRSAPPLPTWLDAMLPQGTQRYRVDVGDLEMAFMEVGEGHPVVMVHGNPTWGFLYRKVVNHLAGAGFRCIMPDLIGLGFSDRVASEEHTLENHATWLRAGLQQVCADKAIFVGQDWGGPIGLLAMAEQVEGMVLGNTVVGPPKSGFRATFFHRFARMPVVSGLAFRLIGFPQNAMAMAQGDRRSIRGKVARAYRYPLRNRRENQAPLALARMVPDSLQHPSIPALQRCQGIFDGYGGPLELVWGMRDPVLGKMIYRLEKTKPQASVTRTQAGHFLQEEVPGELAQAIRNVRGQLEGE